MIKHVPVVFAAIFALSTLAVPAAFAEDSGGTAKSGTPAANAGGSGEKADKSTQENANSADKDKQHK